MFEFSEGNSIATSTSFSNSPVLPNVRYTFLMNSSYLAVVTNPDKHLARLSASAIGVYLN